MPEEEAFASLVHIMYELKLRELFKPNMAELGFSMFQLEFLIQVGWCGHNTVLQNYSLPKSVLKRDLIEVAS